jgi:DNA helicase IV
VDDVREREIRHEQHHLDAVYRRLEEKIHEAEFLVADAASRVQVGTPGALAERDAQVFRAGLHLSRLNSEFEDFLFGRIDLLAGKDGERGPDGAYTSVEPADDAIRRGKGGDGGEGGEGGDTAEIAETLHIGRLGVLDAEYTPLVIDWRAPAAAAFYRATPVAPGRVVRRRVIRSRGRRVLGVEDDLLRPGLTAWLDGAELPVVGDGALMAALGQARGHRMRDIVASIQAEQDRVIRAPAASVTEVTGGPGTGKTAVALHRAAYLLYQNRRRYAGGILIVSPTPLLVAYTEGVLPSLGEEGQVAIRALGSLVEGVEADSYDEPAVARLKGSARMARVLHRAARGVADAAEAPGRLRVVAFGTRIELEAEELAGVREQTLGGTAPVNLLRPRARRLLLDALWRKSGGTRRYPEAELAEEAREAFFEDVGAEDAFCDFLAAWWPEVTPLEVLRACADERRLSRWARRVLRQSEVRQIARSLRRVTDGGAGLSVHDVALLDELRVLLGTPARTEPPRQAGPLDALDQLTGLEELTTYAERLAGARPEPREREREDRVTDYAHVIVDEAQDLTPMQWRMVGRRGRRATWTIVGDPAQSSWPEPEEAARERDAALGDRQRRRFELTVNYRNSAEIAAVADRVLRLAMPGARPPRAVRATGVEPAFVAAPGGEGQGEAVREAARRLLAEVPGTVGVVVAMARREEARAWLAGLGDRLVVLGSLEAKGLEYDATLVVSPAEIAAESPAGPRVLYVALTRATQRLTILAAPADAPDDSGVPALLRA